MPDVFDTVRAHLMRAVPFATHTGVVIETVQAGAARASLAARPETANHIGTPHAGAMFTLGEAASGAALAGAFALRLGELRPVAAQAQIRYLKLARGTLLAEARTSQTAEALNATLDAEGKVVFAVEVRISDETGAEVGAMSVDWHVSRRRDQA